MPTFVGLTNKNREMVEFKGTKGKWKTIGNEIWTDSGFSMILGLSYPHNPNNVSAEIQRANALLMSKAPEMLEFITYVSNTIPKGSMLQEKAEQLIKEATELRD